MPWKIFRDGNRHCVHKEDNGGKGELVPGGCHGTRGEAVAHMRALYASEAKEITDQTLNLLKEIANDGDENKPERASAVLDEWKARIVVIPDEEEDSEVEEDEDELETEGCKKPKKKKEVDFVQVGDIPYVTGTVTFSSTTDDGISVYAGTEIQAEKAEERCDDVAEVKAKGLDEFLDRIKEISDAVKSWFKKPTDETGLSIWKEGNTYWWMARYSNKFRDNDYPPEIISSDSHKRFVELVKEGKAPLPELWVWHKKDWKVGNAHGIAYDELGFAVALGTFDVGREDVAEALLNAKEPIKVSHGMPKSTIKYDEVDPTIIVEHETREISPLPAWAAANKLTGFAVLNLESKEESMAIPDETKQEWISKLGIKPETLKSLEAANAADADKAISEGLESKEAEVIEEAQPATQETEATPEPTQEPVAETVTLTVDQLHTAVREAVKTVVDPVIERINTIESGFKELKEANEKRDEALKGTPTASLSALLGQFAQSAIGAPETRVDGRTSLAQSKPKEAAAEVERRTKIPFIDEMLAGNNH